MNLETQKILARSRFQFPHAHSYLNYYLRPSKPGRGHSLGWLRRPSRVQPA